VRLVAVSGYARTGKDSIVGFLVEDHGFTRVAFADIMRECALALDPLIELNHVMATKRLSELVEEFGWDEAKERWAEVRRTLQRLGTEVGRNILGQNIWVDAAFNRLDSTGSYAIADARFWNEAIAVERRDGQVWRVERPGYGPVNDHPSETGLDDWPFDVRFVNDRTLEDLRGDVAIAVDALGFDPLAHVSRDEAYSTA
jgi:hypothetical protein